MGRGCSPQRAMGMGCSPQRVMERGCSLKRVRGTGCSLQRVRGMGCCLRMGMGKRLRGRMYMSLMTCHCLVEVLSWQNLQTKPQNTVSPQPTNFGLFPSHSNAQWDIRMLTDSKTGVQSGMHISTNADTHISTDGKADGSRICRPSLYLRRVF
jgi:hypothetical protein